MGLRRRKSGKHSGDINILIRRQSKAWQWGNGLERGKEGRKGLNRETGAEAPELPRLFRVRQGGDERE